MTLRTLRWRPMASAPKDGTRLVVWRPSAASDLDRIAVDYWENDCWWLSRPAEQPSHWMPLQDVAP